MNTDFCIIGGGIIGLAIAKSLKSYYPDSTITLIEKEPDVAAHASGRNSGVLHAGFYYSADSLKAKFCRDGNKMMREYCAEHNIKVNDCGKIVVARNESEIAGLHELKRRGDVNQVKLELITEQQSEKIEPNVRTTQFALHSPTTASVDPVEICQHMRDLLRAQGVNILTNTAYVGRIESNKIRTHNDVIEAGMIINCAGVNACDIAQEFGFARDYTILPFKGVYLKYTGADKPLRTLLYSVPDMRKPFLGVHFAIGVDGTIKIGPTAIPAFWRRHYGGLSNFDFGEMLGIVRWQAELFARNSFGFREFAIDELKKYRKSYLIKHAFRMAKNLDAAKFNAWSRPGIRAQLLNTKTLLLVQDFIVESDSKSLHILNAVSPAFTSSLAFAEWVVGSSMRR